ncbi:YaiI/YqxD family protein [Exiguobacterium flavidum]|uniref:YaiI/YqxD family protein n=1 Tax=Exiguobacterium flavidum TaxID=2184695 RepID=UPI000DF7767B|nr:YaiI/YqxD family protein [Exiguobacterium flavidum]
MKILIDADGCPVVDLTISIAKENGLEVILVCDTAHEMNRDGARTITVGQGADAVDYALVNQVAPGDIVVTQDFGLGAMVLAKRGLAIDQNGRAFTEDNMDQLLFARHLGQKIRRAGGRTKGPRKRTKADDLTFKEGLSNLLGIERSN